jgi:AcrR family transcriptional regulator
VTENGRETQEASRRRGRPRRAAAGAAIIEATLELLAERGFQSATMDAIAARACVGKNTIYRRWKSKEELIAVALRELTAEVELKDGDDIYAILLEYVRDFAHALADPLLGRILPGLLGELQRNPEFAAAWAERVVGPRRHAVAKLLRQALRRGELRKGTDPDLIADLLVGPQFLRLLVPFGPSKVPSQYPEALLKTVWHGIAPATPR